MSNKLGKFVLFSAIAGAAAAGTYYLLQKNNGLESKTPDDIDEFDEFDENLDEDDDIKVTAKAKNRSYVSLDFESAKELVNEKVSEAIDKTKEVISEFNVSEKIEKAKEFVGEFVSNTANTDSESPKEANPFDEEDLANETEEFEFTDDSAEE